MFVGKISESLTGKAAMGLTFRQFQAEPKQPDNPDVLKNACQPIKNKLLRDPNRIASAIPGK